MNRHGFARKLRARFDLMQAMTFSQGPILQLFPENGYLAASLYDRGLQVSLVTDAPSAKLGESLGTRDISLKASQAPWGEGYAGILHLDATTPGDWDDELVIRLVKSLAPGGRLLCRLPRADAERLFILGDRLGELGAGIVHAQVCDVFDANSGLRDALQEGYEETMRELSATFELPGAVGLWEFLERLVLPWFPLAGSAWLFVIVERGTQAPSSWADRPRLESPLLHVDVDVLRSVGGSESDAMQQALNTLVRTPGGLRLLVTLDQMISRFLPLTIDFMSFLDEDNRARILDLVAWRWTQTWHSRIPPTMPSSLGIALPPLLEYEVFQSLARILKPLKESAR